MILPEQMDAEQLLSAIIEFQSGKQVFWTPESERAWEYRLSKRAKELNINWGTSHAKVSSSKPSETSRS